MDSFKDNDFGKLFKPLGRPSQVSVKPLGVSNCISSFDRKAGFYGSLPKSSPQTVRKTLFETKNKENDESTLCKDFSFNRDITGKSPIVVTHKVRSGPNSDEGKEKRPVRPRRSMLGQRGKSLLPSIPTDDNTYTISRPLLSSSPISNERRDPFKLESSIEPRLMKATSTPALNHPFDTNDADTSAFFSKGLSDSTWSVFKPNKKSQSTSENYPFETPLSRGSTTTAPSRLAVGEKKTVKNEENWKGKQNSTYNTDNKWAPSIKPSVILPTAERKMKLEWLALKFQQNESPSSISNKAQKSENENDSDAQDRTTSDKSYQTDKSLAGRGKGELQNNISGKETIIRTRAQLRREKEKYLSEPISPIHKADELGAAQESPGSISCNSNDSTLDSTGSYVHNEATIVGKSNLPDINEESLTKMTISNEADEETEYTDCSEEFLSSNEVSVGPQDFSSLLTIMKDLEREKDELNSKFSEYVKQKESFDRKWDTFSQALNLFISRNNENGSRKKSNIVPDKRKHKKVVSTKARRSFMSPKTSVLLPSSSKSISKNNYSDLKANFSCLKTPVQSKTIQRLRKSTCYTPNSLSVLVGDQVKDIFGDS